MAQIEMSHIGPTSHELSNRINICDDESSPLNERNKMNRYFVDGIRLVDFVLVYDKSIDGSDDSYIRRKWRQWKQRLGFVKSLNERSKIFKRQNSSPDEIANKRIIFEDNLKSTGLEIEYMELRDDQDGNRVFIKIHVPIKVLKRFCDITKIKMPLKQKLSEDSSQTEDQRKIWYKEWFKLDSEIFPKKYELKTEFNIYKEYLYNIDDPNFFTESIRMNAVAFELERQPFTNDSKTDIGIDCLINDEVYTDAYPLHDGGVYDSGTQRNLLFMHWAQINKFYKYQPLDKIKEYFGEKFAIYFAWLGFYIYMLIPISLLGIVSIIYGIINVNDDTLSNDICYDTLDITMCPKCDSCDYWKLESTCFAAKVTYVFDNYFTIGFAFSMSVWSAFYGKLWKRYSAEITHGWGMTEYDNQIEHLRPQYLTKYKNRKRNFWTDRLPTIVISVVVVTFFIGLVWAIIFGIVIYQMWLLTFDSLFIDYPSRSLLVPCISAVMNLIMIMILDYVFVKVAIKLTENEYQRTQSSFDDSLTLKIYFFQFVNNYSSILYIAILKGKFLGYPSKYNKIFLLRQQECLPGGCLFELIIQLAIIMIGKKIISLIMKVFLPFLYHKIKTCMKRNQPYTENKTSLNQWTEDDKLVDWCPKGLFNEYLDTILNYGFATLFVSVFPLAPLFALICSIIGMRLDAKKFVKYYKRPVPRRARNIGIWFTIMDILGKLSIITNAFTIAFTSNFIPRMIYIFYVSLKENDVGFLEHSLAYFETSDIYIDSLPQNSKFPNVTVCRYPEYRNPPDHVNKYKRPIIYWQILVARLLFIVVFMIAVGLVMAIIHWIFSNTTHKLKIKIKEESQRVNETIERLVSANEQPMSSMSTQTD
ncbi:anoctamin-5-like [Arctopsyche grandis]|uniref:anoctamin-5-like n=1 Tax=Arctopsyche grandis TaxID=121162 RepID=UPI00406D8AFC